MLSVGAVKAARPRSRAYKLWDADGLHLLVSPSGSMLWRWRKRGGGREQLVTLGQFPALSLHDARARRDAARIEHAAGRDPAAPAPATFEAAARAWLDHRRVDWSPVHAADVLRSLEVDVFPAIGAAAIAAVTAPELTRILRAVEARGARESARRLLQRIDGVFKFAQAEGWCAGNPAEPVGEALRKPAPPERQPAIVSIERARALVAAVDALPARPIVQLASRFLALTGVRLAALLGARWSEIEGLTPGSDGVDPVWRVPAARMKLGVEKKRRAENDHLVPLSRQAVAVLEAVRDLSSAAAGWKADGLIFSTDGAELDEAAIGALYHRAGFAGEHVPHGWRATASTILNEELGPAWAGAIDRALAHVSKDRVEAAYNRSLQLSRRRELFQRWGDLLFP